MYCQPKNRLPPSKQRPGEVTQWINTGRRFDRPPVLNTPLATAMAKSIRRWWCDIQPSWRNAGDTWPLDRSKSRGSWEPTCRGGSCGLFLVVLVLSWLPPKLKYNTATVSDTLDDVLWAMQEINRVAADGSQSTTTKSKSPTKAAKPRATGGRNRVSKGDAAEPPSTVRRSPRKPAPPAERRMDDSDDSSEDDVLPSSSSRKRKAGKDKVVKRKKQKVDSN